MFCSHSCDSAAKLQSQIFISLFSCYRDDIASSSTFTLEDSAICLTSEQSTMDVDLDRDDGSVLDIYLVSRGAICYVTLKELVASFFFFLKYWSFAHV